MRKIIVLMVGMLVISCGSEVCQNSSIVSDNESNNSILAEAETDYSNDEKKHEEDDFLPFWIEYREAVLEMDTNKLIKITNFPLTVKGYEDNDPVLKVSINDFFFIFDIFLNTGGGVLDINNLDDLAMNNLDFIKRSLNAEHTLRYEQNSNYQRIGDQVFEKIEGKWILTLIYTDTKEWAANTAVKKK
ncbi:MAG: hypothetical protein FWH36_00735 [Lentimicrobiaceae bacterium]|nr:hypothetical protein [Lentimicrobiaceae bacterium]